MESVGGTPAWSTDEPKIERKREPSRAPAISELLLWRLDREAAREQENGEVILGNRSRDADTPRQKQNRGENGR